MDLNTLPQPGIQIVTPLLYGAIIPREVSDPEQKKSYLGTPIYSNLIFNADSETPENQSIIIDTVLMAMVQNKIVVKTMVSGRPGTVKEYISLGDYEIEIAGVIVSEQANVFPRDQVIALENLLKLGKEIAVSSNFLQLFSIHSIVVERYRIEEKLGTRNEVPFSIFATSDAPFEIKINQI